MGDRSFECGPVLDNIGHIRRSIYNASNEHKYQIEQGLIKICCLNSIILSKGFNKDKFDEVEANHSNALNIDHTVSPGHTARLRGHFAFELVV
jgi:hypothetical protein